MRYTHSFSGRAVLAVLLFAAACKGREVSVASGSLDTAALGQFRTFSIMAPPPPADSVAVLGSNGSDRVTGAVIDMDPMLSMSLVGRAIKQDLIDAFTSRGYKAAIGGPDFHVFYYAGTGNVVDTRASEQRYRTSGRKITTETREYPAGTIVVDVVDARTDSLVWRGTGVSEIPKDPNDYARAIHETVGQIVGTFPRAGR